MYMLRKNLDYPKPIKPRRLKLCWTCSDYTHHEHRWYWVAWLCGRVQLWLGFCGKCRAQQGLPLMDKEDCPPMPEVKPPRRDNG